MNKIKSYIGLALIGGLLVILPSTLFILAGRWLLGTLSNLISPASEPLRQSLGLPSLASDILVVVLFLLICMLVGVLVRTAFGRWVHNTFDHWMVKLAPGYKTIRGMVHQLVSGDKDSGSILNGEVVLAKIFGPDCPTTMTGIVTSKHPDGTVTVYVPTAPVPTSGLTYHVPGNCVEFLEDVSAEEAMRTIIACGAGTAGIIKNKYVLNQ